MNNTTSPSAPPQSTIILKSKYGKSLLLELSCTNINTNNRQNHKTTKNGSSIVINNTTIGADLTKVLEYINQDPLAGRYKDSTTGDNAYHVLLNGDFSKEFLLTVLKALIEKSPKGLEDKNLLGMLPIHIAMYQRIIMEDIVFLLLQACPKSAKIAATDMLLTPLFYAVMRDNPSYTLVKKICDIYPDSVKQKNKTNSLPIHFACKRIKPNLAILQLFIDLYPDSLLMINSYSWIPLHCLVSHSDDLKAVKLLIQSCPSSVSVVDRQGRACLHLAVLLVGKDHETAILQAASEKDDVEGEGEDDHTVGTTNHSISSNNSCYRSNNSAIAAVDARAMNKLTSSVNTLSIRNNNSGSGVAASNSSGNQKQSKATVLSSNNNTNNNKNKNSLISSSSSAHEHNVDVKDDSDSDDDDSDNEDNNASSDNKSNINNNSINNNDDNDVINDTNEVGSLSRQFIHYLIQQYPQALILTNNFQATPLDTVIEKLHKKHAAKMNNTSNNKTKRNLYIWGLHDDPITARILLAAQQKYFLLKILPRGLKLINLKLLYDLNWTNRKYAMWASYGGNHAYFLSTITSATASSKKLNIANGNSNNSSTSTSKLSSNKSNSNKHKGASSSKMKNQFTTTSNNIAGASIFTVTGNNKSNNNNNLLLKIRLVGHEDCIKLCMAFL